VKADCTRNSFDPLKHYSRVLMQQGRVQLDADWNEQTAIVLHFVRRFIAEALPSGGGSGFAVSALDTTPAVNDDVAIGGGAYFAGGILCELETTPFALQADANDKNKVKVAAWTVDRTPFRTGQYLQLFDDAPANPVKSIVAKVVAVDYPASTVTLDADVSAFQKAKAPRGRRVITYRSQPDLPNPPNLPAGQSQLYLDVWERLITSLEDDSIREVALNGPDTAARTRIVWQLKAVPFTPPPADTTRGNAAGTAARGGAATPAPAPAADTIACMTVQSLEALLQPTNAGVLRARTQPTLVSTDPCTIAPDSRYRGPENQLYRVEIHAGSGDAAHPPSFKWSRENGSVVFPLVKLATGDGITTATLGNLGRDDRFGLAEGDYVEIQDDRSVLNNAASPLLQVRSIDRANLTVTLAGTVTGSLGSDPAYHPLLRRWDHKAGNPAEGGLDIGPDGAVPITANDWLNLEDGVQIQFPDLDHSSFRTADYWLIPARVATGDVLWPTESGPDPQGNTITNPVAKRPDGIRHHYAPLGVLTIDANNKNAPTFKRCTSSRTLT
jgi:hypothetical protein